MACRLLVYALGGGFGHLTRACALARAALPKTQVRILTNSPYADCVTRAMPEMDIVVAQGSTEVLRRIADSDADGLVVDTFPRGLAGELVNVIASFPGLRVFVQRDLNPDYVVKYNLRAFVASSYDLVLDAGDSAPDSLGTFPRTVTTAPWLIRAPAEILPRNRARHVLGLHDDKASIVICAAGNREELAWYNSVFSRLLSCAPKCEVRLIAPVRPDACPAECWLSYWPAMDLYSAADVLIGGAGYNTVYEAAACGVPLVARAWPRKYDRQNLRALRAARMVDDPDRAAAAALELIGTRGPVSRVENGTAQAIAQIRREILLHRNSHCHHQ